MRILKVGFIVLFMAMLILPLAFVNLSSDRISVYENRMLAARPKLADIKNHPGTFVHDFDAWFKDSTGFREQLVKLYNGMTENKGLNGIYYTDGQFTYLIGEQGHHYFTGMGGSLISAFEGKNIISDEQLTTSAAKLEEVKRYLDRKNIPFVVMFCTTKESIYPEFYPKSIKRGPEPIQLDVITTYLQNHISADVFNIRQALLAEKNSFLLYYKIDSRLFTVHTGHYTQTGAFFAYRELMKHINAYIPEMLPYDLKDINISDEKRIPAVSLKVKKAYQKLDSSFFNDVNYEDDFRLFNAAYENTDTDQPVILLLCDSYSGYFAEYVAQHFGKTIMIHHINMEHLEEYVTRYKPDIVVFESVEYMLMGFANSLSRMPELK